MFAFDETKECLCKDKIQAGSEGGLMDSIKPPPRVSRNQEALHKKITNNVRCDFQEQNAQKCVCDRTSLRVLEALPQIS